MKPVTRGGDRSAQVNPEAAEPPLVEGASGGLEEGEAASGVALPSGGEGAAAPSAPSEEGETYATDPELTQEGGAGTNAHSTRPASYQPDPSCRGVWVHNPNNVEEGDSCECELEAVGYDLAAQRTCFTTQAQRAVAGNYYIEINGQTSAQYLEALDSQFGSQRSFASTQLPVPTYTPTTPTSLLDLPQCYEVDPSVLAGLDPTTHRLRRSPRAVCRCHSLPEITGAHASGDPGSQLGGRVASPNHLTTPITQSPNHPIIPSPNHPIAQSRSQLGSRLASRSIRQNFISTGTPVSSARSRGPRAATTTPPCSRPISPAAHASIRRPTALTVSSWTCSVRRTTARGSRRARRDGAVMEP